MTVPYLDPIEQRQRVLDQVRRWQERHRKKPSHLLEVQLAALLRLDDMIAERPSNMRTPNRKIIGSLPITSAPLRAKWRMATPDSMENPREK
jgi:hypothetical protein